MYINPLAVRFHLILFYATLNPLAVMAIQIGTSTIGDCDLITWANTALSIAYNLYGVNYVDYAFRHFVVPSEAGNGGCQWGGAAYLGCSANGCRSWVRQPGPASVAHELGHNAGLHHASTDTNNDGAVVRIICTHEHL